MRYKIDRACSSRIIQNLTGRNTLIAIGLLLAGGLAIGRGGAQADPAPRSDSESMEVPAATEHRTSAPVSGATGQNPIQLCQALSPADPNPIPAGDCFRNCPPGYEANWNALGPVPDFQEFAQGEYVGRARLPHVPTYRLRVDDVLDFVFRVTRNETPGPYEINVGDELSIESGTELTLKRTVIVLPDGTITLPFLGQVRAAHLTVPDLRAKLEELYEKYMKSPAITLTPIKVDTKLEDLRYTVGGRSGFGGQVRSGRVTPEGTIQLPAVGSVPAQGLTLDVFREELAARFAEKMEGIEVMPVLTARAPRYVYVLGEVKSPGRYSLEAPTTVMQAIAIAGSWNVGAHIDHIVVFRRADDWRLIATVLDLRAALLGRRPSPPSEIWVGDADLIIVPKSNLLRADNFIELIFTRGLYGIVPFSGSVNFTNLSYLTPVPTP